MRQNILDSISDDGFNIHELKHTVKSHTIWHLDMIILQMKFSENALLILLDYINFS